MLSLDKKIEEEHNPPMAEAKEHWPHSLPHLHRPPERPTPAQAIPPLDPRTAFVEAVKQQYTDLDFAINHNILSLMTPQIFPLVEAHHLFEAIATAGYTHEDYLSVFGKDDTWEADVQARVRGAKATIIAGKNDMARLALTVFEELPEDPNEKGKKASSESEGLGFKYHTPPMLPEARPIPGTTQEFPLVADEDEEI